MINSKLSCAADTDDPIAISNMHAFYLSDILGVSFSGLCPIMMKQPAFFEVKPVDREIRR
jgi:hypothetical protein